MKNEETKCQCRWTTHNAILTHNNSQLQQQFNGRREKKAQIWHVVESVCDTRTKHRTQHHQAVSLEHLERMSERVTHKPSIKKQQ